MIRDLVERLSLTVIQQIKSGHRCKHVYRVLDSSRQPLILKVADDTEGTEEIRNNIRGYEKLNSIGLQFFIPIVVDFVSTDELSYILMQDCGDDLVTRLQDGRIGRSIYGQITDGMIRVYEKSLRTGKDASLHVGFEVRAIQSLHQDFFLQISGSLIGDRIIKKISERATTLDMPSFCFASWDFMPGNIFITKKGIKFVDPKPMVTGMPILDLACLGGVLKDVHHFPDAAYGMLHFRRFALETLARLLSVSKVDAFCLYLLGRLLQNFLSLREACVRDDIRGKQFFAHKVELCLKQFDTIC